MSKTQDLDLMDFIVTIVIMKLKHRIVITSCNKSSVRTIDGREKKIARDDFRHPPIQYHSSTQTPVREVSP